MSFWDKYEESELKAITLKSLSVLENMDRNDWVVQRGAKEFRIYTHGDVTRVYVDYIYKYPDYEFQDATTSLFPNLETGRYEDRRNFLSFKQEVTYLNEDGSEFTYFIVPNSTGTEAINEKNKIVKSNRIAFLERNGEELLEAYNSLPPVIDVPTLQFLVSQGLLPPSISSVEIYNLFRDELKDASDGVSKLFEHYRLEISDYKERTGRDRSFENAIRNETSEEILKILSLRVPPNFQFPQGLTIRQAVSYQLFGVLDGL